MIKIGKYRLNENAINSYHPVEMQGASELGLSPKKYGIEIDGTAYQLSSEKERDAKLKELDLLFGIKQ